jgi:hypothetical protein
MKVPWPSIWVVAALCGLSAGCKKSSASLAEDGSSDAVVERGPVLCSELDGGTAADDGGAPAEVEPDAGPPLATTVDEFGPNTAAAKVASSLGRVNLYEVTATTWLQRVEVYLRAGLAHTRLTLAIHEATGRDSAFKRIFEIQLDFPTCEGWASSGALAIPLEPGRFYAMGFDPNQVITPFVSADSDSIPIDGAFGRLVGSKTSTSVSINTLTWDKSSDKEFNRQRLTTAPRPTSGDASADAPTTGGGGGDGATDARDAAPPADAIIDTAPKS